MVTSPGWWSELPDEDLLLLGGLLPDEDLLLLGGLLPDQDVLLLAHSLAKRLPQGHLSEVLQRSVDGVPDGLVEHRLHAAHQNLNTTSTTGSVSSWCRSS